MPASPKDIAAWDISPEPLGLAANLPPGKGTVADGAKLFQERCAACHGEKGEGKPSDRLVGGIGSLTSEQPVRTVGSYWPYATTLFDYVRRAMPLTEPQSLTNDEVYALSAFILNLNGIIGPKDVMNAKTLPKVKMPQAHDASSSPSIPEYRATRCRMSRRLGLAIAGSLSSVALSFAAIEAALLALAGFTDAGTGSVFRYEDLYVSNRADRGVRSRSPAIAALPGPTRIVRITHDTLVFDQTFTPNNAGYISAHDFAHEKPPGTARIADLG